MSFLYLPPQASPSWKASVATAVDLPSDDAQAGDARVVRDTNLIYIWSGSAWVTNSGSGSVTAVSVATANGFAGSSSGGATPALTLSTTVSGILKGSSGALAAATVADYPTLNQDTTGTASNVTGTVAIAHGGTGQTTASAALTALWPAADIIGTTTTMLATTGVQGQKFYNTTYNAWFSWIVDRWWVFGSPDPRYGYVFTPDDFVGGDRISTSDWGSNSAQLAGTLLNIGISQVATSAASSIFRQSLQLNAIQLGTMDVYLETIMAVPTLSNGTDNACFTFGLNDGSTFSATGACTDGVYFTLDPVSTAWITNTSSNGTLTAKTSSTIPVAGTYYRLGILIQGSTSATFYVNGVAITAAHTTNLPTGAGRQTGVGYRIDKTLGSGSLSMSVDAFAGYAFFNGARVS